MRSSHVARHVLRHVGAHPSIPASALMPLGAAAARPFYRTYPVGCRVPRTPQRRTFLGFLQKPPRAPKEIEAEPGYETLLQFRANENENLRPPPKSDLVQGWKDFFGYKSKRSRAVNSTQAFCARRVLLFLSQPADPEEPRLDLKDLRLARDTLAKTPKDASPDHLELAKSLYTEIRRQALRLPRSLKLNYASSKLQLTSSETPDAIADPKRLIALMSFFGEAAKAKEFIVQATSNHTVRLAKSWGPIIRGLAKEGNEKELLEAFEMAEADGIELDPGLHAVMTRFYAQRDAVEETKRWFGRQIANNYPPRTEAFTTVLQFARRNNETEWAKQVYEELIHKLEHSNWGAEKPCWDASYCWAVILLGKGVDHVEHMFRVNLETMKDRPACQPDIGSINALLRIAIDNKDPYLAERIMSLSDKMGFEPDLECQLLRLEYRLSANDLDGAYAVYKSMHVDSLEEVLPHFNELIRALCTAPSLNYEHILEVTSFIEERRETLEPQTVVSICLAFLRNDEQYEVMDTLSLHTAHYSISERQTVRKAFVDYCLDGSNSTARVWDAYALLRQFFPEVEREHREAIMDMFFSRHRADMASNVFGHMRQHSSAAHRPTTDTYTRFLMGIGRCPDPEGLATIHNMLKTDTVVQPNTQMLNALMIAYIACDHPDRALDFWTEITTSAEGPSYSSLEIAFRAYEVIPYGFKAAGLLWEKILRMEIDVPAFVYTAYVCVLAAHGGIEQARGMLLDMENVVGERPKTYDLALVYNAIVSPEGKDAFEVWAQEEYSAAWRKLRKSYRRREVDGLNMFKITRDWKA